MEISLLFLLIGTLFKRVTNKTLRWAPLKTYRNIYISDGNVYTSQNEQVVIIWPFLRRLNGLEPNSEA